MYRTLTTTCYMEYSNYTINNPSKNCKLHTASNLSGNIAICARIKSTAFWREPPIANMLNIEIYISLPRAFYICIRMRHIRFATYAQMGITRSSVSGIKMRGGTEKPLRGGSISLEYCSGMAKEMQFFRRIRTQFRFVLHRQPFVKMQLYDKHVETSVQC